MNKPKHPCPRNCAKRKSGCHNRKFCSIWGVYEDEKAVYMAMRAKSFREADDVRAVHRTSVKRYLRRAGLKEEEI